MQTQQLERAQLRFRCVSTLETSASGTNNSFGRGMQNVSIGRRLTSSMFDVRCSNQAGYLVLKGRPNQGTKRAASSTTRALVFGESFLDSSAHFDQYRGKSASYLKGLFRTEKLLGALPNPQMWCLRALNDMEATKPCAWDLGAFGYYNVLTEQRKRAHHIVELI